MNGYQPPAAGITRQNILARLLGSPDGQVPPEMMRQMQMMQGDPNAAPYFPPQLSMQMPEDERRNLLAMLLQRMQRQ